MGEVLQDYGPEGGICLNLRHVLQGGSPRNPLVCIIDLGDDPHNRADPRKFPPQVGLTLGRDATTARYGGEVVVTTFGGIDGGRNGSRNTR